MKNMCEALIMMSFYKPKQGGGKKVNENEQTLHYLSTEFT
jgi:hypothetical protein